MAHTISSGSISSGMLGPQNSVISTTNSAHLTLGGSGGESVSLRVDGKALVIGDAETVVRIPGTLEVMSRNCLVCNEKPELGVLLQGEKQAILFCPTCARDKLAGSTVQDIIRQYEVMRKVEEAAK